MAKIRFREVKLSQSNKERLDVINNIIEEYQEDGYVLTLRQLYYQLVSRDVIPNKQSEYSKLSALLKEGRMGGIVDWDAIEDRLRKPYTPNEFTGPKHAIQVVYDVYRKERMKGQKNYIEVWVEKDALSGVLTRVTSQYHIPILVNRGYSSASAMFDSYQRFKNSVENNCNCTVLYLGDYDPSGIDMIRDIRERTSEFFVRHYLHEVETVADSEIEPEERGRIYARWFKEKFEIVPVALTRQQINQYDPPENPAKRTDPRAEKFIEKHGSSSWEVDALRPEVLNQILIEAIEKRIDLKRYKTILTKEKSEKKVLQKLLTNL